MKDISTREGLGILEKIDNLKKIQIKIKLDKKHYRSAKADFLKAGSSKAKKLLKLVTSISFTKLVKNLMQNNIKNL